MLPSCGSPFVDMLNHFYCNTKFAFLSFRVKHFIHESKKAHTAKPVYQYALKCGKLNALFLCSLTGARIFSAAVGNNRVFSGGKI